MFHLLPFRRCVEYRCSVHALQWQCGWTGYCFVKIACHVTELVKLDCETSKVRKRLCLVAEEKAAQLACFTGFGLMYLCCVFDPASVRPFVTYLSELAAFSDGVGRSFDVCPCVPESNIYFIT